MPESDFHPRIEWTSERTLRVTLGDAIGDAAHRRVRAATAALAGAPALADVTPAYTTVMLTFDLARLDPPAAEEHVRAALRSLGSAAIAPGRLVEIPVCYASDLAPDLAATAALLGMSVDEMISRHSSQEYAVQFLGFSPGFAYLAGLAKELEAPRLERPRPRVPAGSVGIAGAQAGVYPRATPGGWRLIGRTPLVMFDADRPEPSMLNLGDRVRFAPISRDEYDRLSGEC